jgi:hypothetical protein
MKYDKFSPISDSIDRLDEAGRIGCCNFPARRVLVDVMRVYGGDDQRRRETYQEKDYSPRLLEGEFTCPQEQAAADQTDGGSNDILKAEAVQNVRDKMNKKDTGEKAEDVVVPLHGVSPERWGGIGGPSISLDRPR